ncbi:haloalkane dehalogenase [Nannocystis sp. SCPEA4]|uniref:haloalkane dehalogenase n=1 Tax=Nannocystis sp. SCPEA4 TaxID=2996787 RepID=UPI00226E1619|nr:haloalkane dehalogenase [Nannocystis sp. SCPEA4]MCY1060073.1 haloalkane dehalogenase [Nannocystis sp. SCPEA4]
MTATPEPAIVRRLDVLDSFLSYREVGSGAPIVFLHGNPTSSYVWRNVLPLVAPRGRCLAPDLIGMGRSGKPDSAYRFQDHARYLDAWFDALALRDVVLVGFDWGGVLALDWARRHADRVRGVVVFETFLQSMRWSDYPPQGAELFRALRTPGVGEAMVLEQNVFLERSLGNGVKRGLAEGDRAEYYAPFPDPASRRPMLQWPREIPIDGEPADVAAVVDENGRWLAESPEIPKLLLTFDGNGLSNSPAVVAWAQRTMQNLEVVPLGAAGHHAPEDAPDAIGGAIVAWLDRHVGR